MALPLDSDAGALLELAAGMEAEAKSTQASVSAARFAVDVSVGSGRVARRKHDEEGRKKHSSYLHYPVCIVPDHRVHHNANVERQRHSCTRCFLNDWRVLKTNPFIVPWQMALIFGTLTRQYVCLLCVLEKADASELAGAFPKQTKCKKHWVFNRQSKCTKHNKNWYLCFECVHDPRAGKRGCLLCGKAFGAECCCPRTPDAIRDAVVLRAKQLPEEQAKLMDELRVAILKYAELLQGTRQIEVAEEREAKVEEIKSTFGFPCVSGLNRTFKSA